MTDDLIVEDTTPFQRVITACGEMGWNVQTLHLTEEGALARADDIKGLVIHNPEHSLAGLHLGDVWSKPVGN